MSARPFGTKGVQIDERATRGSDCATVDRWPPMRTTLQTGVGGGVELLLQAGKTKRTPSMRTLMKTWYTRITEWQLSQRRFEKIGSFDTWGMRIDPFAPVSGDGRSPAGFPDWKKQRVVKNTLQAAKRHYTDRGPRAVRVAGWWYERTQWRERSGGQSSGSIFTCENTLSLFFKIGEKTALVNVSMRGQEEKRALEEI